MWVVLFITFITPPTSFVHECNVSNGLCCTPGTCWWLARSFILNLCRTRYAIKRNVFCIKVYAATCDDLDVNPKHFFGPALGGCPIGITNHKSQ